MNNKLEKKIKNIFILTIDNFYFCNYYTYNLAELISFIFSHKK